MKTWTESELRPLIEAAAARYKLNPAMLFGQLKHESANFSPAVLAGKKPSSAGALGIGQFMPKTAAEMGVDPLNVPEAVEGAARYMAQLTKQFGGDEAVARQAYNWGPGNLRRHLANPSKHPMPKETRDYLGHVAKAAGVSNADAVAMRDALRSVARSEPPALPGKPAPPALPGKPAPAGGATGTMPEATPFAAAPAADWRAALPTAGVGGSMNTAGADFAEALQDQVASRQDALLAGAFADTGQRVPRDTSNIPGAVDRFLDKLLLA